MCPINNSRKNLAAGRPLLAVVAAGLFFSAVSAGSEVRSYDGGAGTAIPAVSDSRAKGGNAGAASVADGLFAQKDLTPGQASPVTYLARLNPFGHFASTMSFFQGAANACDLNSDGTVNQADVDLAINMSLGLSPCTASVLGTGVCNVIVVQRIINTARGGACVTGNAHTVSLSWVASTSSGVAGYRVFRGATSGGPYTPLNSSSLATGTSYVDGTVQAGQTYYYVVTAVDGSNNSSVYSNEAQAVVPFP